MKQLSRHRRFPIFVAALAAFIAAAGGIAPAVASAVDVISIPRPGDNDFVLDKASLLNPQDVDKIKALAAPLLKEKATPIVVVTINSMAEYGGANMRIETFARLLFDQWGVGHAKLHGENWNTGILLLVSKGDRKARIELGAYWKRDQDRLCDQIMNEQIIPRFKQGNFSGGIVAGVEALDKMARGLTLPAAATQTHSTGPGLPKWVIYGGIALLVFTLVSMARKGSGGWAWLLWAAVFGIIGTVLYSMLSGNRSSGSGGGFSGGSFGGGFSGGGGSTGSW
jgi:uncharacterized protein